MDPRHAKCWFVAAFLVLFFAVPDARAADQDSPAVTVSEPGNSDELRPVAIPVPTAAAIRFHQTGNWLWAFAQLWAVAVPAALLFSGLSARLRTAARGVGGPWIFAIALYAVLYLVLVFVVDLPLAYAQLWAVAVPAALLLSGRSARLRTAARRIGGPWIFAIGVYALLYLVLVFVVDLPLAYYAGFVRQHAYGLSHQTFARWFGNALKSLVVDLTGGFLFLWVPYLLLARSPRRWWIYTAVLSVPFSFFVMLIAPIWIDPLFNKFGPMTNTALEHQIAALADRVGISESRIYEVDRSADSRALNAYVKGFMTTKRIVLYDTLLAQLDDREVLAVMGHEMGHYALGHVTRTILLSFFVILLCLFVVDRSGRWLVARFSRVFGFESLADVASVPLLVLLLHVTSLMVSPVVMLYSRFQEHEADVFALELTQANHSAAAAFAKLQQENLGVPWHGVLEELWRATHPSIGARIEFCNKYHPWTEGQPLVFGAYFQPDPGAAAATKK